MSSVAGGTAECGDSFVVDLPLVDWQEKAVAAWAEGDGQAPFRGTLEIFTGGGKSLVALGCISRALSSSPGLRIAVVVPTLALARQWTKVIAQRTSLRREDVGQLHGGQRDHLRDVRVLVTVLNSAARHLPAMTQEVFDPVMLVVDESHRAGARSFSQVLTSRAEYRLGLSATAERDDVDEDGAPVSYMDHVLGRELGEIVYRFDLRAAREAGWLPRFSVTHHAVQLHPDERLKYDERTRRIDDLAEQLSDSGVDVSRARTVAMKGGTAGETAKAYVAAVAARKDLLYRARERARVTLVVVSNEVSSRAAARVLLFHERIDEAVALFDDLGASSLPVPVGLEHSRLSERARQMALDQFADGSAPVLVSVKSLVEGIDVPDADVGVSVASSSSVRQRVQALGRVLRRRFDSSVKEAAMHVIYVADTADEAIYEKEDWSDLTGRDSNVFLKWPLEENVPVTADGPPRTPRPTEQQFWESIGQKVRSVDLPLPWPCEWPRNEWRLDSRGSITDLTGRLVGNPQGAVEAVRLIRPGGGRFRISRLHHLLVVPDQAAEQNGAWVVGQLQEPFSLQEKLDDPRPGVESGTPTAELEPGATYTGLLDREGGTFSVKQKSGGSIERRTGRLKELALEEDAETDPRDANAQKLLAAWRQLDESGLKFFVNSVGDAYYLTAGVPRFLAHVPEGFAWPTDRKE